MKDKPYYLLQMSRAGVDDPTDRQLELYQALGSERFLKLKNPGFHVAYAERLLNREPKEGSYQRDMINTNNMVENLVYKRIVTEKWDLGWYDGFIESFSEENCLESFRQAIGKKRLDQIVRENDGVFDLE